MRSARASALAFAVAAVVACQQPPRPTVASSPALERPTLTLNVSRAAAAHVLVPAAAIVDRAGTPGVFVLQKAAPFPPAVRDATGNALPQARFRMVKPGKRADGRVEILSGLAGDEVLVLGDLAAVRDGSPIVVRR